MHVSTGKIKSSFSPTHEVPRGGPGKQTSFESDDLPEWCGAFLRADGPSARGVHTEARLNPCSIAWLVVVFTRCSDGVPGVSLLVIARKSGHSLVE